MRASITITQEGQSHNTFLNTQLSSQMGNTDKRTSVTITIQVSSYVTSASMSLSDDCLIVEVWGVGGIKS